jgi:hypothetical protein
MAFNMNQFQGQQQLGGSGGFGNQQQQQGGNFDLWELLFGAPSSQISTINPGQEQLQQSLIPILMQLLQGGEPAGFKGIEDNANRNFYTNTVPSLAERFTAMGGGQRSSAFKSALGQAGSGLQSSLGALKSQFGQNQLSQLLGPSLQSNRAYLPATPGLLQSFAGAFGQGAGKAAGTAMFL